MRLGNFTRRRSAGFTLVEILVAFALFGLLFSVLYGGLRLGAKTSSAIEKSSGQSHADHAGRSTLRASLEDAILFIAPRDGSSYAEYGEYSVSFSGDSKSLRYVSEITSPIGVHRPYVFQLELDEVSQNVVLRFSHTGPAFGQWSVHQGEKAIVASNVNDIDVSYLAANGNELGEWQSEWSGAQSTPVLIRISIDAHGRDWPDLVVQPRNALDTRFVDDAI